MPTCNYALSFSYALLVAGVGRQGKAYAFMKSGPQSFHDIFGLLNLSKKSDRSRFFMAGTLTLLSRKS
jgi:hypothetical protein